MVVAGAGGFIGSHLVDRLLSLGHRVVGLNRRAPDADELAALNLANALTHERFSHIQAELEDTDLTVVSLRYFSIYGPRWGRGYE